MHWTSRADAIDELEGLGVLSYSAVGPVNGSRIEDGGEMKIRREVETVLKELKCGMGV